jgi:heterodisulfide reductase subunit D
MLDYLDGKIDIPVMTDLVNKGETPEYLFWVGCAGAFDDRYKKVSRAFASILNHLKISYAVLGTEETCTGDPARRAGNEMLFQMQAFTVIETLNRYSVKKILTICPHCYNIFKNEYPDLGGKYEVLHYAHFFAQLINEGKLNIKHGLLENKTITYHDSCYLGRANKIYNSPREILSKLTDKIIETRNNRSNALCCGAGGAQMFKEAEIGNKEIFIERTEQLLETKTNIIASSCPFCMVMISDGLKYKNKENDVKNYDIIELIAQAL